MSLPLLVISMLFFAPVARAATFQLDPEILPQGQLGLVRACLEKPVQGVRASLLGRDFHLSKGWDGCWHGLVGLDLLAQTGTHPLQITVRGVQVAAAPVRVVAKDYGTRRITVSKKYTKLREADLARHLKEIAAQRKLYVADSPKRFWQGPWRVPVNSKKVGNFGRRSIINGQPRSPHGGVDLRGTEGTEVFAPAVGRVVLVQDSYFGGLIVVLDHGQGLLSAYRHLSVVLAAAGQTVRAGEVIAKVGSSGRVTGPHLHFDVHLQGARVDPLALIALSRRLARRLGDQP